MNAQNIFQCSLCDSTESLDFEKLKTHLRDFHNILQTQRQTFLLALIVVEFDHDDTLQRLMTEMQERVERMLSNEDAETTMVNVQDDDEIREDLKEEILKQTETYDVDDIQQKIRVDLESDVEVEDEDDPVDKVDDPLEPTVMVQIKEEPQESYKQSSSATNEREINNLNLYEKFKNMNLCRLCYSKFDDEEAIDKHEEEEHNDDQEALSRTHFTLTDLVYNCSVCPKIAFLTQNLLIRHEERQHKIKRKVKPLNGIICKLCYKVFKKEQQRLVHYDFVHKGDPNLDVKIKEEDLKYSCTNCSFRFVSENLMQIHQQDSHDLNVKNFYDMKTKSYKCKLCHLSFNYPFKIIKHINSYHSTDKHLIKDIKEDDYVKLCDQCDLKFITEKLMDFHRLRVHFPTDKKIPCSVCGKKISRYNYGGHKSLMHSDKRIKESKSLKPKELPPSSRPGECPLCYLTLKSQYVVPKHLRNVHVKLRSYWNREIPESELLVHCQECNRSLLNDSLLDMHRRLVHKKKPVRDAECHLCYKKLKGKYKHLKSMHADLKEYWFKEVPTKMLVHSCKKCDKVFMSKELLRVHKLWHITETYDFLRKPSFNVDTQKYTCKLCLKSYLAFDNLKNHFNNVHQNDLDLLKKDKIEEEDLLFNCPVTDCIKKYPAVSSLNYHKKIYHCLSVKGNSSQDKSKVNNRKSKLVKLESRERYCQLCNILYKKPYFFQSHKKKIHSCELDAFEKEISLSDLTHQCSKCNRSFYSENTLAYHHHVKHYTGKVTHCTLCDHDFKNPQKYKLHKYKVHKFELELFKKELIENNFQQLCPECPKKFATKSSLDFHSKVMHKKLFTLKKEKKAKLKKEGERHCKLCFITYKKSFFLDLHKKNIHSAELNSFDKDFTSSDLTKKCSKCPKRFYTEGSLMFHIKSKHHSSTLEKKYECSLCYEKFKFISNMTKHKKKFHTSNEEIQAFNVKPETLILKETCKYCNLRFLNANCLRHHVTYKHKEERKKDVSCEYCNVTFQFSYSRDKVIKNHMKNVHNVKDYSIDGTNQARAQKNMTVENFMNFFNSLTQ